MARKKNYRPLIALAALAVAALALATMTFTNVTYWLINATLPPAMKYPGEDATSTATSRYVKVSYYYDSNTGYNITKISIVGFTGDPTNYTKVLSICNKYYSGTLNVQLQYVGEVSGTYSSYVKSFFVYFTGTTNGVGFITTASGTTTTTQSSPVQLGTGDCVDVGVYVVIDPQLYNDHPEVVDGQHDIATYQVNVVFSTS